MICNHWDVVAIPFPFVEKPAVKRRPALVISTGEFNSQNNHSILSMITTAKLESWPSDHMLQRPSEAGLFAECYVRWKVFTMPNSIIVKKLGELGGEDREELMKKARMNVIRA